MKLNSIYKSIVTLVVSLLLPATLHAEDAAPKVYKVGDKVEAFQSKDKFDNQYTFQAGTNFLLVSFDMSTGKKANKSLAEKGAEYLGKNKAVYMANIHGMPGIGRAFAIPKMKKYPHPIILADDENLIAKFPSQEGKVTVLKLNTAGKIQKVSYWDPATEKVDDYLK